MSLKNNKKNRKGIPIVMLVFALLGIVITLQIKSVARINETKSENALAEIKQYEDKIKELENKIADIQKNQYISEAEAKKQIEALQGELEKLKASASTSTTSASATTTTHQKEIFIYTIENGKAIITGFTGDDQSIVIPSSIDDFDVYGIASNAFENYTFKSVIISDGIEEIDWFAFYNCKELEAITIPQSVRKIGYSAFEGCNKQFTVYCAAGSFAESYAKSYGITYALI